MISRGYPSGKRVAGQSSNVLTVSVLLGVIGLAIATSLPGGVDGGVGFLIGFLVSFVVLTVALTVSEIRVGKAKRSILKREDEVLQCPVCSSELTLTLTARKASHNESLARELDREGTKDG